MSFIEKNYITVDTRATVNQMVEYIAKYDIHAYDTETTSLNTRQAVIIGFSISAKPGDGYYLPTKKYIPETDTLEDLYIDGVNAESIAKVIVEGLLDKKLVMHNGSYDCAVTKHYYGIELIDSLYVETLLLVHTVAEEGAFGYGDKFALKAIARWKQEEFGLDADKDANEEQIALKESIRKNGGATTKKNFEMYKADLDVLCRYGAADADLTIRVYYHFIEILKEEGLEQFYFEDEVMPAYRQLTYPMELRGVRLDLPLLEENLKNIEIDIEKYRQRVSSKLMSQPEAQQWVVATAVEKYPYKVYDEEKREYKIKNSATNAQVALKRFFELTGEKCPLPAHPKKEGDYHITKATVIKHLVPNEKYDPISEFLLNGNMEPLQDLDNLFFIKCSMEMWKDGNGGHYINLSSNPQVSTIVFDYLEETPLSTTEKGQPRFDDDFIASIKDKYTWSEDLYVYKRLNKIKSAYFDRLWERRDGDRYYFQFKQHGTVSGRYGSDAQQMPRPMEEGEDHPVVLKYSNEIRALMIPDEGWIFVDADYESLEPRCFSAVAGDQGLKDIFSKGHDFYSTIAIATEKMEDVSADKKADNYLGRVNKPKRQKAKAYCLDGDTLVNSDRGILKIKDVVEGDFVKSKNTYNKVLKTFKRKANTCIVHTNRGSIRCTLDHPFYVDGKWIDAQDLKKGMPLIEDSFNTYNIKTPLPIFSNMSYRNGGSKPLGYLEIDTEWAYFIGMILGDGMISINQNHNSKGHGLKGYVGVCGLESDGFISWFDNFMKSLGFTTSIHKKTPSKKGSDWIITKRVINSELCKVVYDTLGLGLWSDDISYKCKNLEVPTYIFNSTDQVKIAFIAGLLDTDGYVKDNSGKPAVSLCSKDFRLITGFVNLLKSLGVKSSIRVTYNKTYERNYYVTTLTREGCKGLYDLGVHNYMNCVRKRQAIESYKDYSITYPSRLKDTQVIEVSFDNKEVDVYDITVEHEHNFFANGILVHNCLGVPYGMTDYALAKTLDVPKKEAGQLIEDYLNAYPELKKWMEWSNDFIKRNGYIKNKLGRVRHIPNIKVLTDGFGYDEVDKLLEYNYRTQLMKMYPHKAEDIVNAYRDFKNGMNNAKNFQIQSLAASLVTRAGLGVVREAKKKGLDIYPVAQIHDQWIFMVRISKKEESAKLIQYVMENETKLEGIDLKAPPEFAMNWRDGH